MSNWIEPSKRRPAPGTFIIFFMASCGIKGCGEVFDRNYRTHGGRELRCFDGYQDLMFGDNDITHWMLFPKEPEE